jgi:hypothetical protein
MDKTIATFSKNKFQDVHVSLREYKFMQLADIRTWTQTQGSDEKVPTAKGVSINIGKVPVLIEALQKLYETYEKEKNNG